MNSIQYVSPGDGDAGSTGGGGPEDDPRFPRQSFRASGLMAVAFGLAMGLTFMVFFLLFKWFGTPAPGFNFLFETYFPNIWKAFLIGFGGGTVLSGIYNMLMIRRLNLFGLESLTG